MKTVHNLSRCSLALALSITLAAQPALACGGYGSSIEQRRTDAAMVTVSNYVQAMSRRNAFNAINQWHETATAHFDHNGCCPPPSQSALDWVSERIADRTYRIVSVTPLTVADNGAVTVEAISQGARGRWSETITVRLVNNRWLITGLSARSSATRAK